jgi:FMN phosphatase YigB (HAD superfamily)
VARPKVSLLVTDLDNTLYDWFKIWYGSFKPMLDEILRISGLPEQELLAEIREVHQRRGTSEYSALLQELPSLGKRHPDEDLRDIYGTAIEAFRAGRKETMRLYPDVLDTLMEIKNAGVPVVAYTESFAFYTSLRLRWLKLDGVIDVLYSPEDHDFPTGMTADDIRTQASARYSLQHTRHLHTPKGVLKPDVEVLTTIVDESACDRSEVIYVGDSLMKDVAMAQAVGVMDVWAEYGVAQDEEGYDLLRSVSHWTQADVDREREIGRRPEVAPTYVLSEGFGQLLDLFEFKAPSV